MLTRFRESLDAVLRSQVEPLHQHSRIRDTVESGGCPLERALGVGGLVQHRDPDAAGTGHGFHDAGQPVLGHETAQLGHAGDARGRGVVHPRRPQPGAHSVLVVHPPHGLRGMPADPEGSTYQRGTVLVEFTEGHHLCDRLHLMDRLGKGEPLLVRAVRADADHHAVASHRPYAGQKFTPAQHAGVRPRSGVPDQLGVLLPSPHHEDVRGHRDHPASVSGIICRSPSFNSLLAERASTNSSRIVWSAAGDR